MLSIDLTGKNALVIGGSRGIGAAIVERLCDAGATTVFTHTGNPENRARIDALIEEIRVKGGDAEDVSLDALDSTATRELVRRIVSEKGRLDILVVNVGANMARPIEESTDDEWRRFIDLNLTSAFYATRAAVPPMVESGAGRVILIGSSARYDGGGGAVDYAAAKTGLTGLMVYLTRAYTKKGVTTNIIHPCLIETDLLKQRYSTPEAMKQLSEQTLVGRVGKPDDIAGLTAFLASSWGDFICGQEFLVDGGRTQFRGA